MQKCSVLDVSRARADLLPRVDELSEIYLDHNATTPLDPRVATAMRECERAYPANPSSQHAAGRRARQALDDARDAIATLLGLRLTGLQPDQLLFTSGGTESNNLALIGLADRRPGSVVISPLEHASVGGAAYELERRGRMVRTLPVDSLGHVDRDQLEIWLAETPALLSVQLANHETGVLQNVAEIATQCRSLGVPMHTDAVQAVGKVPVDFAELGVAALSAAAHKFHGPRGIGLLALAGGIDPAPLLFGGFQQQGRRPGTEPLALIIGMRTALELWQADQPGRTDRLTELRDVLEARLLTYPGAVAHSAATARLPQTTNVSFPGLDRQALLIALDLAGVACSTGSACASGSSEPSPVLRAMGCAEPLLESALRFSLGATTERQEVLAAADRILNVCNDLRARGGARKNPLPSRS